MNLVFCGTPQFAVPSLRALLSAGHRLSLVVTQPDRPRGRGGLAVSPPVKLAAVEAGLEVVQPERVKNNPEFQARLEAIRPDAIAVVAYGRIIPKWMLDLPPAGNLNVHASLLPKYRGAAPIQWAIACGETVTGVTIMRLDEGLDTGPILVKRETAIGADQTAEDLAPVLARSGADLLCEALERLAPGSRNSIVPVEQDHGAATLAPILRREDAEVDFSRTAREIYNRWRGFQPWPGAFSFLKGKKLILHRMDPAFGRSPRSGGAVPGEVEVAGERIFVQAGDGAWIELVELQWEGKKRLGAAEFLRGAQNLPGARLGA